LTIDRRAVSQLRDGVQAVMGWGATTHHVFSEAANRGIRRILGMISPHDVHFARVSASEARRFPDLFPTHAGLRDRVYRKLARFDAEYLKVPNDLAQLVVANSRFSVRTLREAGYQTPVEVIPLGIDGARTTTLSRRANEPFRFLFAGTVSPLKGAHHLIEAWNGLAPPSDFELVLAGEWQLPESWRRRLSPRIRALGRIPRAELESWYEKSSVLVLPSLGDGFGAVVLEALAYGLPVVTTDATGAAEILDASTGWVVPAGNREALVETLRSIVIDPHAVEAMRAPARETAGKYSWSRFRERLQGAIVRFMAA
jgi:glycosyltransferase involved in cell wall biosynthesis